MTDAEIERHGKRLREVLAAYHGNTKGDAVRDAEAMESLRPLALGVGACICIPRPDCSDRDATPSELAYNIHQALQTASMINACRTAAENVRLSEKAQAEAYKARQHAFLGMAAAWAAVIVNIVVAYIMAAKL